MGEEDLRQFLKAWLEWAESGGGASKVFSRYQGLCNCATDWVFSRPVHRKPQLLSELRKLFIAQNLNPDFPFGGRAVFSIESVTGGMHLNPERLAWVRSFLCQTN